MVSIKEVEEETKSDVYEYTCDEIEKLSPIIIDDAVDKKKQQYGGAANPSGICLHKSMAIL